MILHWKVECAIWPQGGVGNLGELGMVAIPYMLAEEGSSITCEEMNRGQDIEWYIHFLSSSKDVCPILGIIKFSTSNL